MATTVIPPGYAQIAFEIRHDLYNRPAVNVFGVELEGGFVLPTDVAEAAMRAFAAEGSIRNGLDTNAALYRVRAAVGQDGGPPTIGDIYPSAQRGSAGINSTSPALALRALWTSAVGGRRGRGSQFRPWSVAVGNVSETGQISAGAVTAALGREQQFFDSLVAEDVSPVILHALGVSATPPPTAVIAVGIDPVISNQVRRQVRR